MKGPVISACCLTFLLAACDSKRPDPLQAEKDRLEADKVALAAEKERMSAEHDLALKKVANDAEAQRLAAERAKLEIEKERQSKEQAKLDTEKAEKEALERTANNPALVPMPTPERTVVLDPAIAQIAEERRRIEAIKVQADADRLASERLAAEARARELAAKRAEAEAASLRTIAVFYDILATQGEWFETDRHGFVWRPKRAAVDSEWRPYTDGRWQWTEYGWTWQSMEPYGWAVYHFGRWFRHPGVGWLWAPGHEWAPAWVSWRVKGNEYVGWAPLPPDKTSTRPYGGAVDRELDIAPGNYAFLSVKEFDQPTYVHKFVSPTRLIEMLRGSRNVTLIDRRPSYDGSTTVVAGGPDPGMISSTIRMERNDPEVRPVPQLNLVLAGKLPDKQTADVVDSGAMMLFAPKLEKGAPTSKPKTVQQSLKITERENGWSDTTPQYEAEWRSMIEREAAYAAALAAAAKNPPKPVPRTSARPSPNSTPKPQPRPVTTAPGRPNPLNPSKLEPSRNLFDR